MTPHFGTHAIRWIITSLCLLCAMQHQPTSGAEPAKKPIIRVALYADKGATMKSLPEVLKSLPESAGFEVTKVTAAEIRSGVLAKCDVLICPGGSGSGEGENLGQEGRERIREFVKGGGGFIGICAGAYLASIEYPWSLGLLNAHVLDRPHWDRGQGDVQLKISSAGRDALRADQETCTIHFENGPLLGPGNKDGLADYEVLAAFDSEINENGAPKGAMKGTTAIARSTFGKGCVVCFSPHPEKTPGREPFLQSAVRWAAHHD